MKQEERNQIMIKKILENAMVEFGAFDYNRASLNHICDTAGISKGIIYHYFENKDNLYLKCVESCFSNLIEYYENVKLDYVDLQTGITEYIKIRLLYFNNNPQYKGLFYHAILNTPPHLKGEINKLKQAFDKFNLSFLEKILLQNKLNNNITIDMAVEFLNVQITMFHDYFQNETDKRNDMKKLILEYENKVKLWLDIILYGLIKEAN